jgi:3-deoxy-D-manno-octulosonic-acid transferase
MSNLLVPIRPLSSFVHPTALGRRPTWIASHTRGGEEDLVARVHLKLRSQMPELRTIVVPADPIRCLSLCQSLTEVHGLSIDLWEGPSGTCEYTRWLLQG